MEFKEKILFARAKLNLTQTQLANELLVSFGTINRWEKGKVKPTKKAVLQFDNFCKKNNIFFQKVYNEIE